MHRPCLAVLAVAVALASGWSIEGRPAAVAQAPGLLKKPAAVWGNKLKDPSPKVRRSAAYALGRLGTEAGGYLYVGDLAKRVGIDKDAGVRDASATAIGEILQDFKGDSSGLYRDAGAALKKALEEDKNAGVRRSAAYALGSFGPLAAEATPALKAALEHSDRSVRQNAAWALGRVWSLRRAATAEEAKTLNDLCGALGKVLADDSSAVRRDAAGALGQLGRAGGKGAAPALIGLVRDEKDDVVRKTALDALAPVVGKEHQPSAKVLYPLLDSKDADTARAAALVLGNMGGEPAMKALPELQKAIRLESDPGVQALAAAAINNVGPKASAAIPDLKRALERSRDPFVRRNSALALANIAAGMAEEDDKGVPVYPRLGKEIEAAVPALAAALKKLPGRPDGGDKAEALEEARDHAAEALARMSYPANKEALPALRDAIRDDANQRMRQRCIWALFDCKRAALESNKIDKVLEKVLDEKSRDGALVRYDAGRAFAFTYGADSPDKAVDVLVQMLQDKTLLVYKGTDAALEGTGTEAGGAGTRTKANARDDARYMAAHALGKMGAKAKRHENAMKALKAACKDADSPKLRKVAADALTELGVAPPK